MIKSLLYCLIFLFSVTLIAQEKSFSATKERKEKALNDLSEGTRQDLTHQIKMMASKNKDSIKIFSIEPNTNLIHGDIYTFSVVVFYNLVSKEKGVLKIGFNNGMDIKAYKMIVPSSKIISKNSGFHIFEVKTRAISWYKSGGIFYAMCNLSEYPHGSTWSPLCSDRVALKVE